VKQAIEELYLKSKPEKLLNLLYCRNVNSEMGNVHNNVEVKPEVFSDEEFEVKDPIMDYKDDFPNHKSFIKQQDLTHTRNDELITKDVYNSILNPNKKVKAKKEKKIKGTVKKKMAKDHKCTACDLEFKRFSHLRDHDKIFHPGVRRFLCDICGKGFLTAGTRDTHSSLVHSNDKPFLCDHCGKCFSTAGSRNSHIEYIHTADAGSQCPHCGDSFKYLSSHIKNVHTVSGEKFTCEECGKLFKNKNNLSKHMRYHLPEEVKRAFKEREKQKHKCNDCGEGFIDKYRLKLHEAVKHTGIRSFHCQHCQKSFFRSDHLKNHVASTHK